MALVHQRLLDAYRGSPSTSVADVPDDGYIMQNAGHHLVHAQDLAQLKALLMRSAWLEFKLTSYGVASVVADFRYRIVTIIFPSCSSSAFPLYINRKQ